MSPFLYNTFSLVIAYSSKNIYGIDTKYHGKGMQSSVSFDQFRCFCHIGSLSLQVCLTANIYCLGSEMNVVQMPGNIVRREGEGQETDFSGKAVTSKTQK
jgi:hypothetical protein